MSLTRELEEANNRWNVRNQEKHIIVSGNETKAEIIVRQNYEAKLYDETGTKIETRKLPTKDQLIDVLKEHIL